MSRMAAKFNMSGSSGSGTGGGPSNTSSGPNVQHHHSKMKPREVRKFCTRGEEFFDFLKALGYTPSKHQQYEHFEYLFQDDKSTAFARKLSTTLKTQHCLLPDEIERFEKLRDQGLAIYGADLEEAVSRRHAINEMHSQKQHKRVAKKEEMEKEVILRQRELDRLLKFNEISELQMSSWQSKQKNIACMDEIIGNLLKENEKDIEIDLKLLGEKMEELENSVVQLKKDLSIHRPKKSASQYICQIDGKRLLENEERLFNVVQEMIRKHGTNLIVKEAEYGNEGEGNPLSAENIRKVFAQYEQDFYRTKHCIIYEKIEQLKTEMEYAGISTTSENLKEWCTSQKGYLPSEYEAKQKLLEDNRKAYRSIYAALRREKKNLLETAREETLKAVNKQFSGLTNIKTRLKKKLQEFFTVACTVLKAQKVRISLIRNFVKAEAQLYGRLLSNIEENIAISSRHFKKFLTAKPIEMSDLTLEGQILHFLLNQLGVRNPLELLGSTPRIITFVRKVFWDLETSYWDTVHEKQTQFQMSHKHLTKAQHAQQELQSSVRGKISEGNQSKVNESENRVKALEEKLLKLQAQRRTCGKELQELREMNKRKFEEILPTLEAGGDKK